MADFLERRMDQLAQMERHSREVRRLSLDKALVIVGEIEYCRMVQRELKSAFTGDELNGGHAAALTHPLFLEAGARIAELHEEMKGLI